jgi:aminoglycoside phosphotransferase (APT) family kinase protein
MVDGIAADLPVFLDSVGDTISATDRSALETVFSSSLEPWLRITDPRALTVTHGDAHPWNFLFPRSGQGDPYIVDWQLWHLDVGARDLAFMITLHWHGAARAKLERQLLEFYHYRLLHEGVTGYSFDSLWLDYRRCAVRNLTYPIIQWARGRPPSAWRQPLHCALAAYRELDGRALL